MQILFPKKQAITYLLLPLLLLSGVSGVTVTLFDKKKKKLGTLAHIDNTQALYREIHKNWQKTYSKLWKNAENLRPHQIFFENVDKKLPPITSNETALTQDLNLYINFHKKGAIIHFSPQDAPLFIPLQSKNKMEAALQSAVDAYQKNPNKKVDLATKTPLTLSEKPYLYQDLTFTSRRTNVVDIFFVEKKSMRFNFSGFGENTTAMVEFNIYYHNWQEIDQPIKSESADILSPKKQKELLASLKELNLYYSAKKKGDVFLDPQAFFNHSGQKYIQTHKGLFIIKREHQEDLQVKVPPQGNIIAALKKKLQNEEGVLTYVNPKSKQEILFTDETLPALYARPPHHFTLQLRAKDYIDQKKIKNAKLVKNLPLKTFTFNLTNEQPIKIPIDEETIDAENINQIIEPLQQKKKALAKDNKNDISTCVLYARKQAIQLTNKAETFQFLNDNKEIYLYFVQKLANVQYSDKANQPKEKLISLGSPENPNVQSLQDLKRGIALNMKNKGFDPTKLYYPQPLSVKQIVYNIALTEKKDKNEPLAKEVPFSIQDDKDGGKEKKTTFLQPLTTFEDVETKLKLEGGAFYNLKTQFFYNRKSFIPQGVKKVGYFDFDRKDILIAHPKTSRVLPKFVKFKPKEPISTIANRFGKKVYFYYKKPKGNNLPPEKIWLPTSQALQKAYGEGKKIIFTPLAYLLFLEIDNGDEAIKKYIPFYQKKLMVSHLSTAIKDSLKDLPNEKRGIFAGEEKLKDLSNHLQEVAQKNPYLLSLHIREIKDAPIAEESQVDEDPQVHDSDAILAERPDTSGIDLTEDEASEGGLKSVYDAPSNNETEKTQTHPQKKGKKLKSAYGTPEGGLKSVYDAPPSLPSLSITYTLNKTNKKKTVMPQTNTLKDLQERAQALYGSPHIYISDCQELPLQHRDHPKTLTTFLKENNINLDLKANEPLSVSLKEKIITLGVIFKTSLGTITVATLGAGLYKITTFFYKESPMAKKTSPEKEKTKSLKKAQNQKFTPPIKKKRKGKKNSTFPKLY